jgi:hypothetical protein
MIYPLCALKYSPASQLKNQPFYSIVKPSDRAHVRAWIDSAKAWSPVVYNERRSGGHGYTFFHVLKVSAIAPLQPGDDPWTVPHSHPLGDTLSAIQTQLTSYQIPDLPPKGERLPMGTDESERSMPGQEFILVEGIFTASSDALTCIISKWEKGI